MVSTENIFYKIRKGVIGLDQKFPTPYGEKNIVYADWTASGRLYEPIEKLLRSEIFPFVGNTHTETSVTGSMMTKAFHSALIRIKKHVNASEDDIIISSDSGMTGVVNKLQRILGFKVYERYKDRIHLSEEERPIVFVTHMEHHSNQTSWQETTAEVAIIEPNSKGLPDMNHFNLLLKKYSSRKIKIAAITSCSNVTGIFTPYYEVAEIIHQHGGYCFVDFACSAPYIHINMHPENPKQDLDAIYFSPHKFLGGPGSTGILIFNSNLYHNSVPDNPGGGTVKWTNPWGERSYIDDIEERESGGTPPFLQTIKAALCIKLKEEITVENILHREKEMLSVLWDRLEPIPNLHILAPNIKNRLGIISFYIDDLHYNLGVKLLNDRFGIQVRGGCSCAGTYGHYLLHVDHNLSKKITDEIDHGNLSSKPGWIRLSIHPVMTDEEILFIADSVEALAKNHQEWRKEYLYNKDTNEFIYKNIDFNDPINDVVEGWFEKDLL